MIFFLEKKDFKKFFDSLENIIFKDGKILNLKKKIDFQDQLNLEVFLNQAFSIAMKKNAYRFEK